MLLLAGSDAMFGAEVLVHPCIGAGRWRWTACGYTLAVVWLLWGVVPHCVVISRVGARWQMLL